MYNPETIFVAVACFVSMSVLLVELHTCAGGVYLPKVVYQVQGGAEEERLHEL